MNNNYNNSQRNNSKHHKKNFQRFNQRSYDPDNSHIPILRCPNNFTRNNFNEFKQKITNYAFTNYGYLGKCLKQMNIQSYQKLKNQL